ncbi:MAG: response regulator [Opitutaceae bacterium]|nr:response regulator [Opitutaceae bacterium]
MSAPPEAPVADIDLQAWLGETVKALRRRLGLTQEELAWRANLHRTYIADIERGARNVTLRSIESLAKALEMSVGELLSNVSVPASRPGAGGEGTQDILLVEDNATDAALTLRAFRLVKVANPLRVMPHAEAAWEYLMGKGASSQAGPQRPAIILLDLNLPGISGVEFLRRLKLEPTLRDIPVIVLTVSRHDQVIIECSRLGVVNYIVKPLKFEDFVRISPRLNLRLTLGAPRP